ncbi:hypothetical protein F5883DRAFT_641561 [Diaporthe sp. PMI_573]|nr:hypothetical protein F5883DRAFT_641561 [Diaporthaceae sp. PMI_573]
MVYPAVQLQVSSAIQGVTCTSNSAQIQFGNQYAYDIALANWNKADYLVVTSVTGDGSSTITAVIYITDFEGAVGRETIVTVDIGIFNPTNDTGGFTIIPGAGNNTTDGAAGGNLGGGGGGGGGDGASLPSGFDSFDEELDNQIGLVSVDDPDFDAQFFPSPATSTSSHRRAANRVTEIDIEKRGIGDFFRKTARAAEDKAKEALTKIVMFFKDAKDRLEGEALKALNAVSRFTSIDKTLSGQYNLDYYPSNTDTKWGRAYKLYEGDSVSAYCVGCGANGQVMLSGSVSFSIANGFTSGAISANGNLHGVAQLGVVASIVNNFDLTEQVIAQAALSDLVLGGVLTIGPAVKLSAGANLGFEASGSLLAGVTLDWPAISATVDIINSGNTKIDGFKPDVTPAFQAEGSVAASVTPYVKVALEFTFGLLQG